MSMVTAKTIEVGVRGQGICVRGSSPPTGTRSYDDEAEMELSLPLARELYRLLGPMIKLAEKAKAAAPVEVISGAESA